MRIVFVLLLLANLFFFAYTWLDRAPAGDGPRQAAQLNADKIRLLSPQQVAALGPDKTGALADVCAEWGPFGETERVRAQTDLEPLAGRLLSVRRIEAGPGFWAFVSVATRAAGERRVTELRAAGVREAALVEIAPQHFALSLGAYRTEAAAQAALADLAPQGIVSGQVGPRPASVPMMALVIRDPPAAVMARLKELQSAFPGAEVRIGTCGERVS